MWIDVTNTPYRTEECYEREIANKKTLIDALENKLSQCIQDCGDQLVEIQKWRELVRECRALSPHKDVCYSKVVRSEYGYVVYDLDYLRNIKIVREFFEGLGITLGGRFSQFEYLNMDACVRAAMTVAEELNHGGH